MKKLSLAFMVLCLVSLSTHYSVISVAGDNLRIAMILWRGETKAEQGFRDGLKELGHSVQYTTLDADQDRTRLGHILRENLAPRLKEFDYVYTFGTTVSQATRTIVQEQIPQIFNIVAAPVEAGLVQSMSSSGGNISGVTNAVPLELQIKTARKIISFKRLGLLFNSREKNSMAIRESLSEIVKKLNIELIDLRSPPAKNTLQANLKKLADRSIVVDAVYLPQDSFIASQAQLIGTELRAAKINSIGAIRTYMDNGALMGVVPNYYELGKAAAAIVDRHQKGEGLQNIPIYTEKEPILVINMTTGRTLNVDIPKGLLAKAVTIE